MKAISLHQPYATFCAMGLKHYETRSWRAWECLFIGRFAIHASKNERTLKALRAMHDDSDQAREIAAALEQVSTHPMPFGAIIATATLGLVMSTNSPLTDTITIRERALGDWSPDRFAWKLNDVRLLPAAIPYKGQQGIFDIPDTLIASAA